MLYNPYVRLFLQLINFILLNCIYISKRQLFYIQLLQPFKSVYLNANNHIQLIKIFNLQSMMLTKIFNKNNKNLIINTFKTIQIKEHTKTASGHLLTYKSRQLASFLKFARTIDIVSETSKSNVKIQTLSAYLKQLNSQQRAQTNQIFEFIEGTQKINISDTTIFNHFKKIMINEPKSAKNKGQSEEEQPYNANYNEQREIFLKSLNDKSDKMLRTMVIIEFLIGQQKIKSKSAQLSLQQINENIKQLINTTGEESISLKMKKIENIIQHMSPIQIKYYLLILIKNLRIGMKKTNINKAFYSIQDYNDSISSKITQINPMLARPLRDHIQLQQFCNKKNQPIFADVKYDGQRTVIKFRRINEKQGEISLVSRRYRSQNQVYSDLTSQILNQLLKIKGLESITLDGQIVCISTENQEPLPMQFLITRRRKNTIQNQKIKDIFIQGNQTEEQLFFQDKRQLREIVYIFDCLQYNGRQLCNERLQERRNLIPNCQNSILKKSQGKIFNYPQEFEDLKSYFKQILNRKYEGLILKGISDKYNLMGSRIHWGKMKKGTRVLNQQKEGSSMIDLDLIVMGADYGKGKRSNILSSFLLGTMHQGIIVPISKVGSGFKDQDLQQINIKMNGLISQKPDSRYQVPKFLNVDRWFHPQVVFQVVCQQFTRSPLYNFSFKQGYGGVSLRFPVFQRIRDDKSFTQCTNGNQIKQFVKDV